MKNIILAVLIITTAAGLLQASSIFTGNVESVYPDPLSGALRNPALIPAQKNENSLGLILRYKPYDKNDLSIDANITFIDNPEIKYEETKSLAGTAYVSYTGRSGDLGWGIGIAAMDDDQYGISETKNTITGTMTSSTSTIKMAGAEKKTSTYPSLSFSLGSRVGNSSFAGFKLTGGYQKVITDKEQSGYNNGAINSKTKSTNISEAFAAEAQLGFFTIEGNSQAGFIVKSGNFCIARSSIDYQSELPASSKGSTDTPFYRQFKKGPSIVAGGYSSFGDFLGVTLEGEYRISSYYNEKYYDDKLYAEQKIKKTNNPEYHFRGGLEFTISHALTASLGGGCIFAGSSGFDSDPVIGVKKEDSMDMRIYFATAGFDINISKNTKIIAGAFLARIHVVGVTKTDLTMKFTNTQLTSYAIAGIAASF